MKQSFKTVHNWFFAGALLIPLLWFPFLKIEAKTIFVANNGNDNWSGNFPSPDQEKKDGPLYSIEKAKLIIREIKSNNNNESIIVFVRGGYYYLEKPLVFTIADSGTEHFPVTYRAYEGEKPVIYGTKIIDGFLTYKGNILKADLNKTLQGFQKFSQMFVNNKRAILARYPDFDSSDPVGGGFLYVDKKDEENSKLKFFFQAGDIPAWNKINGAQLFVFPGANWSSYILDIESIEKSINSVILKKECPKEMLEGNRFYFQNIFEALDAPGEWYFDEKEKILYYWTEEDEESLEISIPVIDSILKFESNLGSKFKGPSNISFEGFTFSGCKGDAITINNADNIVFSGNTVFNAGRYGVNVSGGNNILVAGNNIHNTGHTGIAVSSDDYEGLKPSNNRIENNTVYNTGVFDKGGASGILCRGVGNIIAHNEIHSMPRVGIWVDGNDHLIEYNHVYDVNRETSDSGIIYFGNIDWTKRGNVIRYNFLHDSGGYGRHTHSEPWKSPYYTFGIYMDDWTSGTHVYGNIIKNTCYGALHFHGGRDNIVENNIIIEGGTAQVKFQAWAPDAPTSKKLLPGMLEKVKKARRDRYPELESIKDITSGSVMTGNRFLRNIVYYNDPNSVLYNISVDIDLKNTTADYNVIYNGNNPIWIRFLKEGKISWSEWQAKGMDQNSVIANLMIADLNNRDFSLDSASPALRLGFKPISFEKIGLYKDRTNEP